MEQLQKAFLVANWKEEMEFIEFQYNPAEITFNKGVQLAEVTIPGLDSPVLQFVRGQAETLTFDMFFDTTDGGMDASAQSVTTLVDQVYSLVKIEPDTHAPPICNFLWNDRFFPGKELTTNLGNQRRNDFTCVVESVRHKYTMFTSVGVPVRATVSVSLKEYKTLDDQRQQLNLNSPDRTQGHVLRSGETLDYLARRHYGHGRDWRLIAEANGIDDPRRLKPGRFLTFPPKGRNV